ncbi:transporter substrate-binding domain-containing protein [Halarcobacter anaerophilus]|uniref:transporter substrate-binding domain-containing protein n=1 Tax=Halarcobacter anaerophilus TaxID=877500 RepID=UPI0006976131|nr:transporter substrate-binding domain-containing protein [Halarcobacter anaerophilus]
MKILKTLFFLSIITLYLTAKDNININLTQEEKAFLKAHPVLKINNSLNYPPFNYNQNGIAKGFSVDYMNLLAKKLGIKIKYITGPTWNQFIKMLKEDKLDAIINIVKTKQRAKEIDFSLIYHTEANTIYVRKGDETVDSLEDLNNKTLILIKSSFVQESIKKYYPNIKQILVDNILEAITKLSKGEGDAIIGKKNVFDYIISKNEISNIIPTNYVDDNRMVSLIRIGVNKKNSLLKEIIKKAQRSVSDSEMLDLKKKWFGTKEHEPITIKNFLTKDEINYISKRKVFRVCTRKDIRPIEFKENGLYKGIVIDILNQISDFTDMRFDFVETNSWDEAKLFLKRGRCDFISTVANGNEVIDFANTTKIFLNYKLAIITQKNKPVVSSLKDILNKKIAIEENSDFIPLLKAINPGIKILKTKSHRKSLEAVSLGEAYFALEALPIASYYISKYSMKNLYISRYTGMSYSINMAINKNNEKLLHILNKSLSMIPKSQYREILNKWTTVSFETIFDFTYFWEIAIILILLSSIFAYRHYLLNKLNKELTFANEEIEKKTIELAKQKLLFETLYNKAADGVILISEGKFYSCNEAMLKILKYKKEELLNKTITDISPRNQPSGELSAQEAKDYLKRTLKKGVTNFEWILTNKDMENIWVEIVFTAIEIENRKVIHAVIRDITKRKLLEQELEDLNINLEKRIKKEIKKNEINTQQLIQQSRLAQMGEMISMIAHQWRQPLSAISATTNNLILKMIIDEKVDKEYFDKELKLITDYSQYLSSTIDDFRNFFKSDKEKIVFELKDIIEKSLSMIKTSLDARSIIVIKNIDSKCKLFTYPGELQQVILNILKNAEDALTERRVSNRKISISTQQENGDFIIINISDNGGGIKESILDKIFDPYFSTKNKRDGTGLGLYMSKIIINEHCEGNLKVKNGEEGAVFSIELPILKEEENSDVT